MAIPTPFRVFVSALAVPVNTMTVNKYRLRATKAQIFLLARAGGLGAARTIFL
jgi:hypothetical protein